MYITSLQMSIFPTHREGFIQATIEMAKKTLREAGNLRYDILQHMDNPNIFILNGVYRDIEGMVAHKKSSHYLRWRDEVMRACCESHERNDYSAVFPESPEQWLTRSY